MALAGPTLLVRLRLYSLTFLLTLLGTMLAAINPSFLALHAHGVLHGARINLPGSFMQQMDKVFAHHGSFIHGIPSVKGLDPDLTQPGQKCDGRISIFGLMPVLHVLVSMHNALLL